MKYPLICERGKGTSRSDPATIDRHEKGHAENRVFKQATYDTTVITSVPTNEEEERHVQVRKTVWARFDNKDNTRLAVDTKEKKSPRTILKELWDKNPRAAKQSTEWKVIMGYALSYAKDEFLADYIAQKGRTANILSNLRKRSGVYDYFARHLGIDSNSALYEELWREYEPVLERAHKVVDRVVDGYFGNYEKTGSFFIYLQKRIENFRWVLAQIPLEHWEKQLEGTLFVQEAQELSAAAKLADEFWSSGEVRTNPNSPKAAALYAFIEACNNNADKPMFAEIQKFRETLNAP